jgi:Carboxypeptidase regulatory-like domain/TonB-dependent Receptor Plug Domain/TonB dependent receptor
MMTFELNHGVQRKLQLWLGALTVTLMMLGSVSAQSFKATVVGQITDSNGAVIPGATVTIVDKDTARTLTATSNDEGSFTISQIPPGNYEVRVEATNFKRGVQSDLVLETDQTQRLNFTLEAGNVSEMVQVISVAPVINSETSDKGEVITNRQVQELPLNGRDATDLAQLVPGVYQRPAEDDQGQGLAVAGTRTDSTNFILDGVNNRSDRNGGIGVNTSVDSIREFKVSTSSYSAEFGRTAGGQINVVSKSGTNNFHGSAFEYVRNDRFDAANFFSGKKDLKRNQFGGTIGGPLPMLSLGEGGPMARSGKDRTFFFASYEGTREERSSAFLRQAPNEAWLRGDFRNVRGPGPDGILGNSNDINRVLRPIATPNAQGTAFTITRVEFPTPNLIPSSLFSPVSAAMLQYIPAANLPASTPGTPSTNYLANGLNNTSRNQYLGKVDHRFSSNNTFFISYARQTANNFDPFPSARNYYPGFGRDVVNAQNTLSLSDTHIFSSRFVNEARFGYFHQNNQNLGQNRDKNYNAIFGIPYNPPEELQGWPAIRIDGFEEFGDRPNDPFIYNITNFQFYDVAAFTTGNHNLRFGGDIIHANYVEADVRNTRGDFRFRGKSTNLGTQPSGSGAGANSSGFRSFADFLLGLPDQTQLQQGSEAADLTGSQYAVFVQDSWNINQRLTLNLGLRYELQQPLTEATGRLATFIPTLREVVLSGDPRFPDALLKTDKNNFAPRVGFALRLFGDDRTVLRGGGGIYHSLESFNVSRQQIANNFPFLNRVQYNRSFISATSTTRNPVGLTFANPFPSGTIAAANDTFGIDTTNKTPEFYQFNLTVERELAKDLAFEIGYVGSLGRHLGRRYNINQSFSVRNANGTFSSVNPFNAQFGSATLQYQEQSASSSYHSMQTSLRRRLTGGLTLLVSYTFSRAIDNASSTNNSSTGTQKFPQNIYNFAAERSLADFHRKHQFTASFNYSLPFGRGKAFFNDSRGLKQLLLGDYQINGIVSVLSGRPFTPQYNAPDVGQQRPDVIGDPYASVPAGLFFNPAAFRDPSDVIDPADPLNLFGNGGRNILIGPGFKNFNLSLLKNLRLGEGARLQFRAEAFNVFNHPNFQVPVFFLDRADVGQVTATSNEGRELQFAIKLLF